MVQDFSSRYPLLAGHGNFGSVDNDPPAAMRYTETRLAPIAFQATLDDISDAIVDFTGNFDNSQQEPVVLPAQLPILVLNGCSGIAVGMATNIPPHHLGEVVDGLVALIDHPELSDEKLWEIIPGPDFPTGGRILDQTGIYEAYRTGKGLIPVQGINHLETIHLERKRNRTRTAIIVTELPFQVNKAAWIEKMADLVNQGKIEGIADLRDESDRTGMRVVIELKKNVEPDNILEKLYKHTDLQKNFGVTLLALVDNKPVQLSLRQLLEEFLKFREETLTRQYSHELGECQKRLHLLEGLLIALNNLDQLINILRHAADGTTAKVQLESRLEITPEQADSILAMPMRRITGLERQKITAESEELQTRITEFETLLNNRHERLKTLKKELRKLKKNFGDERRTRITKTPYVPPKKVAEPASLPPITEIISPEEAIADPETIVAEDAIAAPINIEVTLSELSNTPVNLPDSEESVLENHPVNLENQDLVLTEPEPNLPEKPKKNPAFSLFTPQIPPEDAELAVTLSGEVYWTSPTQESTEPENDPIIYQTPIHQQEQIIVVSDRGKAHPILIKEIPPVTIARLPLLELLSKTAQRDAEKIVGQFFLPEPTTNQDLLLISQNGRLKRLNLNEFTELTNRGLGLIKFKEEGDRIQSIHLVRSEEDLVLATSSGRLLRFSLKEENIPPMGRNAQGNPALRLRFGESLVGCLPVNAGDRVLLMTQLGYGKAFPIESLRLGSLGDIGTTAMQFSNKTDQLMGMMPDSQNCLLLTNQNRQLSLSSEVFNIWTKDGVGDRVVDLETDELINQVIVNCGCV